VDGMGWLSRSLGFSGIRPLTFFAPWAALLEQEANPEGASSGVTQPSPRKLFPHHHKVGSPQRASEGCPFPFLFLSLLLRYAAPERCAVCFTSTYYYYYYFASAYSRKTVYHGQTSFRLCRHRERTRSDRCVCVCDGMYETKGGGYVVMHYPVYRLASRYVTISITLIMQ